MKFNLPINNFTAGEWSPKMRSLVNAEEYGKSCKEITNYFVQMQGGAQYRQGTRQATENPVAMKAALDPLLAVDEPATKFKLVSYSHSGVGSTSLLIYDAGASATIKLFPSFLTVDDLAGITLSLTDLNVESLQHQQIGDYLIFTGNAGTSLTPIMPFMFFYDVTAVSDYRVLPFTAFMDASNTPSRRSIPFGDVYALDNNVTLTTPAGPFTVGGTFTLVASAAYFQNTGASSLDTYIRLADGTTVDAILKVVANISTTQSTVEVVRMIGLTGSFTYGSAANPTSFWQQAAWSRRSDTGYPRTVIAYQGRLIFGGSASRPDTLWGSRISAVFDFQEIPNVDTTGINGYASTAYANDNSRPFALTPNSADVSSIVSLSAGKTLSIHTDSSEIVAYGSNGALGPNNAVFSSSTSFGAAPIQCVRTNNFETFVQSNGYKLRDLVYSFDEDQYKSTDLGFLAEHLFVRKDGVGISSGVATNGASYFPTDDIIECTRYEARSSYLLVRTRRGKLFYVTLDRDYKVNAWGRIVLGDQSEQTYPYDPDAVANSYPLVLGITAQKSNKGISRLWLLVRRTIGGVPTVFAEYIDHLAVEHDNLQANTNPFLVKENYLDCARICTAAAATPTTSWKVDNAGTFPRFKDMVVSVMADGNYVGEVTLGSDNDGAFALTRPATTVTVGFRYPGKLVTSGIEVGGQTGLPLGRIKRIDEVVVRLHNSGSGKVGREDNMEELPIRESGALLGTPTPYFTGDKVVTFPPGYERDHSVTIEQDKPYPQYIVSVAARGVTYD